MKFPEINRQTGEFSSPAFPWNTGYRHTISSLLADEQKIECILNV
jgi:hypothetical protein